MTKINIFLHVPKTGGMTFIDCLKRNFKEGRIWRYPRGDQGPPCGWDHVQCIHGHFHFNWKDMDRDFGDRPKRFYTLLRDPIERVWSYYHHTNGPKRYNDITKWMEDTTEMSEYYRRRANSHIWTLTGHENINSQSLDLAKDTLDGYCNRKKDSIDFGITEYFHHSLMEFQKNNDVFKTIEYDRKNVREGKGEMSSDERSYISSHVGYDMELYQYAKELFQGRVLGG